VVGNRRALSSLPPELAAILNESFDAAAIRERADLLEMERSLQADLAAKGMCSTSPTPCNSAPRWCRPASMSNGRRPMARKLGATGEVHG